MYSKNPKARHSLGPEPLMACLASYYWWCQDMKPTPERFYITKVKGSECDFAVEHWIGCRATEPGFTGNIGAIEVWLIDWLGQVVLVNTSVKVKVVIYNGSEADMALASWVESLKSLASDLVVRS